jgi:hypothetical protein
MRSDFLYPFLCGTVACAVFAFYVVFPAFVPETAVLAGEETALSQDADEGADPDIALSLALSPEDESVEALVVPSISLAEKTLKEDQILKDYRDAKRQKQVVAFFSSLVKSEDLAKTILAEADVFDVSPSLAFALCWEESRFNPKAVNRANANNTVDRGLFQLNNKSFPKLTTDNFFDPALNAYYGLSHLNWCLEHGGSVVAGLAMYNAGTGKVNADGTPKRTLGYISRILDSQIRIEEAYEVLRQDLAISNTVAEVSEETTPDEAALTIAAAEAKERGETETIQLRLALLSPARGKLSY